MPREFRHWQTLCDPQSGRLGRPAAPDALMVPDKVDISGSTIAFALASEHFTRTPSHMLEQFIEAESESAIVSFAKRYGPLALFKSRSRGEEFIHPDPKRLAKVREQHLIHTEQIEWWRLWQARFRLILNMAAHYRESTAPTADEFRQVLQIRPFLAGINADAFDPSRLSSAALIHGAAFLVSLYTATLVKACGIRPGLHPDFESPVALRFELAFQDNSSLTSGISLIGALTVQLLASAAGSGFSVCSACGKPYVPRRRPAAGRRQYCPSCGRAAALRDAKAAYRARLRRPDR
jgi:hypothetical protein